MARILAFLLAGLATLPATAYQLEFPEAGYVPGEVLVKYRSPSAHKAADSLGTRAVRRFGRLPLEQRRLPAYIDVPDAIALLRQDPAIEYVEPNWRRRPLAAIPDDPLFELQWGLLNTGQRNFVRSGPDGVPGADLNLAEAWDADGDGVADRTGSPSVVIAVVDDSVATAHPDLKNNIVPGYDFACDDSNPRPERGDFHGTPVAGAAVAEGNNGIGVAGAAWSAGLMPLRFNFDVAGHIAALEYAADNGASIINASFGGVAFSQAEFDAIRALANDDVLFVAAAGNDDSNTDVAQLNYPANYDADNIITVAATNRQDNIASFSQYGPLSVDVAAPGLQVVTTDGRRSYSDDGGVSGTSFAAPLVAGVAALVRSHVTPTPGYREIRARLIESGTAVNGANAAQRTTGGRVDADAAIEMAPRPSLIIRAVRFLNGDGNNVPDPGELLDVEFTIENLWETADNVMATLDGEGKITATGGTQSLGTIGAGTTASVTFPVEVTSSTVGHQYATLSLALTADGGYSATRHYIAELSNLELGQGLTHTFSDDLYDEYHAWHVDVPADGTGKTLVIRTSTDNSRDIDLLVRHAEAPPYSITVGINPEQDAGFFCTSATEPGCIDPDTLISGRLDGVEAVTVEDPAPGPWHFVVVNFVQDDVAYQLSAELIDGDLRPDPFSFERIESTVNGLATSSAITVAGIDTPTFVTVTGGEYNINGGDFTSEEGTVALGDVVRVRAPTTRSRAQLTIGGVTETFFVNFTSGGGGGGGTAEPVCSSNRGGGGGSPALALLAGLLLPIARRRTQRA